MNSSGMDPLHGSLDVDIGDDIAVEYTLCALHVQASVLSTFKQHFPAVKSDGPDVGVLPIEPPSRQCDPHTLALLVTLRSGVLREAVRSHRGGCDPVVGDVLIPRAETSAGSEVIVEVTLRVAIVRILGLRHGEVVSIRRQPVLALVSVDLLLGAMEEEGAAHVLDIECYPFFLEVSEGAEEVVLPRPPMRSAKVRHDMDVDAAAIATIAVRHDRGSWVCS